MRREPRGIGTSTVEVTKFTVHGGWLPVGERELFMPYDDLVSAGSSSSQKQAWTASSARPTLRIARARLSSEGSLRRLQSSRRDPAPHSSGHRAVPRHTPA